MTTLNLKKQCGGYYTNTFDGVTITISRPFSLVGEGSKDWQLTIENETNTLLQTYFNSKKEAMSYGAKWVINNL